MSLSPDLLRGEASLRLPDNPVGTFLNITLDVAAVDGVPEPRAMRAGGLRLPAWLVGATAKLASDRLAARLPEYEAAVQNLESVRFEEDLLTVNYRWDKALGEQLEVRGRQLLLLEADRSRILGYYNLINEISQTLPSGSSLAELLGPLFSRAASRSIGGEDAAEENRALLVALGTALHGASFEELLGSGEAPTARVRGLRSTLHGRSDLAKHFSISAALAAARGTRLADVVGVFKELSDAQGGSGFSFPDLLADRAGVVLADRATGGSAVRIQKMLAGQVDESLFMPSIDRLPEGLQEEEFRARFEDLDTEAYGVVKQEMERRIDSLPIYR